MDRTCKGQNCSTCSKCVRCKLGLCMGGRCEKEFGGCSKYIHCARCVASWSDEDWEIFQLHGLRNSETIKLVTNALGVDLSFDVMCQFTVSFAGRCRSQCGWRDRGRPAELAKAPEGVPLSSRKRPTGTALHLILQESRCTTDTTELRVVPGNSTRLTELQPKPLPLTE